MNAALTPPKYQLAIVMDSISHIKPAKDTSLAMLLEAQARGYQLHYLEMDSLYLTGGSARAHAQDLTVSDSPTQWYALGEKRDINLAEMDFILMRKDPPVDSEFIYATQILEVAERAGASVLNRPQSLRDFNEKLALARYAEFTAPTLVSAQMTQLRQFVAEHKDAIIKPLDGMGGASIFRLKQGDPNISVVLETLTGHGQRYAMIQQYLPQIVDGDKRILVIDGQPWPYALARIPSQGESRGNLAAGGRGVGQPLTARDREIAEAIGPDLRERGLLFVGLDVIGDYLTEVNVTSPTCVRELDAQFDSNICAQLFDALERRRA
ncbi:MAG: glutathione synthase [Oceanococcus sp.]